ncbi:ATP/GTP-binding protein [Methylomicrobium sp. Wu6]|uniref:GTP-binding protein n=1 Tax=Methylomicrobium sp. Wu6 TaxID=3107928 RepID=UPI002DD62039|nr:ATP/GTP-binding protein [Methylomicrobium sp. Wu6]MEC4747123.1 GTPase [Methylomicrobium sp. Wu6]
MSINNIALIQEIAAKAESLNVPFDRSESNHISIIGKQDKFISLADAANKQEPLEKSELKVVVAGNVGSGKSTSIKAISEIPVISTETKATESVALHRKETTTTAIDYGVAYIANTKIHIYGTPGQRRFDFMADILCKGASGMVVMIDNGCQNPLTEIDYYLNRYGGFLQSSSGVIAITHFDDNHTQTSLLDYHTYILKNGFTCPVMLLDARNKHEVEKILLKLLLQIRSFRKGKK